jgi:DNA primase
MTPRITGGDGEYVRSVLERFGFERVRRGRNGYTALCKLHDEKDPSFSISDSGLWCCFGCGKAGNLEQLIKKLGGDPLDWREHLKLVGAQLSPGKYMAQERKRPASVMPADFQTYAQVGKVPQKILGRLKWDTIDFFELGQSGVGRNTNRCIIPIRYKHKHVGYHGRALEDDMIPKYYNSPGMDIKDYIFNYDECEPGGHMIVVEGAFNAMSMFEKGFDNVVATFGIKFTAKQIEKMFKLAPASITICFDRDPSIKRHGQRAAVELAKLTSELVDTYIMPLPVGKDPNDLPESVLRTCYDKRINYGQHIADKQNRATGTV